MPNDIWTIGHSNRPWDKFLDLLHGASIELLVDIRRFPGSRAHPQFNQEAMQAALESAGIGYEHLGALGGRRSKRPPHSPNDGWRVDAFNRYADYMATEDFTSGLEQLMSLARQQRTTIMCSEAVPWRCHRRLVADALIVRGWTVHDIISRGPAKSHSLTPFARVEGEQITYPAEQQSLPLFDGKE